MRKFSYYLFGFFLLLAVTPLLVKHVRNTSYNYDTGYFRFQSNRSTRTFDDVTALSRWVDDQPVINGADVIAVMRRNGLDPVLVSKRSKALPPSTLATADGISVSNFTIPNVVHYVSFGPDHKTAYQLKFLHYVGFVGVQRFIRPDAIFVHGDMMPTGQWWNRTVSDVENVYFVKVPRLTHAPSGQTFKWIQHASDVQRYTTIIGTTDKFCAVWFNKPLLPETSPMHHQIRFLYEF
jgi:hypothetical protein